MTRRVFVTGATGYLGQGLVTQLIQKGLLVSALARPGSEHKLPTGARLVSGSALSPFSYARQVAPADTFVHLIGTPRPAPWKTSEFYRTDLGSVRAALDAACAADIKHFIYVSVAQPAPIMKSFIRVRREAERLIRASGIPATVLRPWYVLGPGHRWPLTLVPLYWLAKYHPATRLLSERLQPVRWSQMILALLDAVERPTRDFRIVEISEIAARR